MPGRYFLPVFAIVIWGNVFGQVQGDEDSATCGRLYDTLTQRMLSRHPDHFPEFKGGSDGFENYLNLHFSFNRNKLPYQVTLIITFIVEVDGSITGVTNLYEQKGIPDEIVKGLLEFFKKLRGYKPALCNGRPVAMRVKQPVILRP
jgi:hypothetical protein